MDRAGAPRESAFAAGHAGPLLIAHGAANSESKLRAALAESPDFVEADLWVHEGRFEARHERRVAGVPVLFEKWYLKFAPRTPFGLDEILVQTNGRTGLFLDLKNDGAEAARLIRAAIEATAGARVAASAQQWSILRELAAAAPELELFYSADVQAKLDLFLSVEQRDARPRGVSCQHGLLTEQLVQQLHERGLQVVAWTVDDPDRAAELAGWGVDAITTHRVAELRARLVASP
jgi:hypothetical protein